jgi:hypothetical protein
MSSGKTQSFISISVEPRGTNVPVMVTANAVKNTALTIFMTSSAVVDTGTNSTD